MKKINKNFSVRPFSLQTTRAPYFNAINRVLSQQGWYPRASTLYSAPSVKDALNTLYNRKCAFCDNLPIGSPAQVEHYRPKDGVNGIIHSG